MHVQLRRAAGWAGCTLAALGLVAAAGPALAAPAAPAGAPAAAPAPAVAATATAPPGLVVSNLNNSGPGSLRAAITTANATPGADTIDFTTHGVITLASALPSITRPVVIDGTSAPTYTSGGAPVVEVNCNDQRGLVFASGAQGSQLLALSVVDARDAGVTLNASSHHAEPRLPGPDHGRRRRRQPRPRPAGQLLAQPDRAEHLR